MKEEMSQVLRAVPDIEKLVKYVPETYFSGMLDFAAVDTVKTMYQMHSGEY